jgi:uncharacterized membrane protein
MGFPSDLLPTPWLGGGHLVYLPLLLLAARSAPWERLRSTQGLNVFLGTCVALIALWHLNAGIQPGLHFHLLGVTALTLMFGWSLAVLGTGLVVLATTANGVTGWDALSLNAFLLGVVPVAVTQGLLRLSERWLPPNFFVYVFVNGYLAAALAATAACFGVALLLWLSGAYPGSALTSNYLAYVPLIAFPEAWVNGSVVSMLVGLRPQWVYTFEDSRYIEGR